MTVRPSLLVVALCVASLVDWQPVRSVEQGLTPAFRPLDGLVRACLPTPPVAQPVRRAAHVAEARAVWESWLIALHGGARASDPRREQALVPVVEVRRAAQELIIRVPPNAVVAETPVTNHGVLLGFLRPWKRGGERVESGGLARVALLGNPAARPVAAVWQASEDSSAVHFLLTSGADGPTIAHTSRDVQASPGQLAYTRDVSLLGDALPGGLLVGRVFPGAGADVPGGAHTADALPGNRAPVSVLEPILDASTLGHVVIEVEVGVPWPCREVTCGQFASTSRRNRLRLDAGRWSGIATGDLVVQDDVLVGLVVSAGPWSSEVHRALPPGTLLVVAPDGDVVPTTRSALDWPDDWRPKVGWRVVVGHRVRGGVLAGEISAVGPDGFEVLLPMLDPDAVVTVLER